MEGQVEGPAWREVEQPSGGRCGEGEQVKVEQQGSCRCGQVYGKKRKEDHSV